jgi:hypothetical protein
MSPSDQNKAEGMGPGEKQGESGLTMWNAPTRADGTVRDLRRFSCKIENSDDRELVQHAADMLEIAMRQLCSTVSATAPHLPIRKELIERQSKVIQEYFDGDGLFGDLDLTDIKAVLDWVLAAPDKTASDKGQG